MIKGLNQLNQWRALSNDEKDKRAERLSEQLPSSFMYTGLTHFDAPVSPILFATYDYEGNEFVLVPGAELELGFDASNFKATSEQETSYNESAEEYEMQWSINEFIDKFTTSKRLCKIEPMLVEAEAREIDWAPIAADTPEIQRLIKPGSGVFSGEYKVETSLSGKVFARQKKDVRRKDLPTILGENFRLATSDEWEYICGADATTLFRWGDECPCDAYPVGPRKSSFTMNSVPNAFGISMPVSPYDWELVAEPFTMRGGDGGGYICGGAGYFIGWFPLATAHVENLTRTDEEGNLTGNYRRVLPLKDFVK